MPTPDPPEPLASLSDEQLVERCNHGSAADAEAAFATLYRRHRDYVLRLAMRFTRDRELALDVMQETFGYLLGKFPGSGGPAPGSEAGKSNAPRPFQLTAKLTTFLYPVVKHNAFAARRKARRYVSPPEDAPEAVAPAAHGDDDPDDIAVVLANLPEERREVLMLRFVDGMSVEEAAEALGVPVGTIKSRTHLAVKQLRDDPRVRNFFDP